MSDLSWLNPTPHAIAVYASRPLSPVATQHSLPSGRYALLGPDFHRQDRTSFAWRTYSITSSARPSAPIDRRLSAPIDCKLLTVVSARDAGVGIFLHGRGAIVACVLSRIKRGLRAVDPLAVI